MKHGICVVIIQSDSGEKIKFLEVILSVIVRKKFVRTSV